MCIDSKYFAYTNVITCMQYLDVIYSHISKHFFVDVQTSLLFSILVDEATIRQ